MFLDVVALSKSGRIKEKWEHTNPGPGWGDCKEDYRPAHHHQNAFADTPSRKTTCCEPAGISEQITFGRIQLLVCFS